MPIKKATRQKPQKFATALPRIPASIKTVSFRSSISIGPYQHGHVEAMAEVGNEQSPAEVLSRLQRWVAKQLQALKHGEKPAFTKVLEKARVDEDEDEMDMGRDEPGDW